MFGERAGGEGEGFGAVRRAYREARTPRRHVAAPAAGGSRGGLSRTYLGSRARRGWPEEEEEEDVTCVGDSWGRCAAAAPERRR